MTLNGGSGNGGAGAARHALSRRRLLGHAARAAVLLAPGLSAAERASAALAPRSAPAGLLRVGLSDLGSERFEPRIDVAGSMFVWSEIVEPLIGVDADGKLSTTGLAPRWEISPDGKSITFHLVTTARWHDGVEFTADDVKYNFDVYYRAPGTLNFAGGFIRTNVISTTVHDKSTITIALNSPVAPNLAQFGDAEGLLYIVPKHYLEANGFDAMAKKPLGTGPWKFGGQQFGEWAELESNTDYRDPARVPRFKTARIFGIAEPATRVAALRTGQVDIAQVDPNDVPGLQLAGFTMRPLRYGALTVGFFLKGYDAAKIANHVEFRRALNLAIDRQAIFKAIYPPGDRRDPARERALRPRGDRGRPRSAAVSLSAGRGAPAAGGDLPRRADHDLEFLARLRPRAAAGERPDSGILAEDRLECECPAHRVRDLPAAGGDARLSGTGRNGGVCARPEAIDGLADSRVPRRDQRRRDHRHRDRPSKGEELVRRGGADQGSRHAAAAPARHQP